MMVLFMLKMSNLCLLRKEKPTFVRLGDQNLAKDNDGASPVEYKIKQFIKHEKYNSRTKENDIALIELEKDVRFNTSFIRPACLQQNDSHNNTVVAVIKLLTT
jgi:hypothetical protein